MIEIEATQQCRTCGEVKPLEEFDFRADTGKRKTQCKGCRRTYQAERYRRVTPQTSRWKRTIGSSDLFLCTRCRELRPATEFPPRAKGSVLLQSWCRACFATYNADNHQRNHEQVMKRIRRNQARYVSANRARLREYLNSHPCVDCGETDPIVLDFDHVRGEKVDDVSRMVSNGWPWAKIALEIEKCDVRCANDHRRVTHRRRQDRQNGVSEERDQWRRPRRATIPRPADSKSAALSN